MTQTVPRRDRPGEGEDAVNLPTTTNDKQGRSSSLRPFVKVGFFLTVCVVVFLWANKHWGANAAAALSFAASVAQLTLAYLTERGVFKQASRSDGRRRQNVAVLVVVCIAAIWSLWWFNREPNPLEALSREIRIGFASSEYPGWHSNVNGEPTGFDVDLARAIQNHVGSKQITWVDVGNLDNRMAALRGPWRNRSGVEQRPVDLVVSNFSMTAERAEQIDMAGPYFIDTQGFMTRVPAEDLADIPRGKVCVLKGSTSSERLSQRGWNPIERPSLEACISAFTSKEVDAVSGDRSTLAGYAKAKNYPTPLGLGVGPEKYGVGLPNNRPRLCREISKAIDDFLAYQWSEAFEKNLVPIGLEESHYIKPDAADDCQPTAFWNGW